MKKKKRKKIKIRQPKPIHINNCLELYSNIHRNKIGIIYGCGPSLNNLDITKLGLKKDDVIHIVMKLALLSSNVPKIDYYFFGDKNNKSLLYENKLKDLNCKKFGLIYEGEELNPLCYDLEFCNSVGAIPLSVSYKSGFQLDISKHAFYKSTTFFPCIQFAFYLGLTTIYIVGLDGTNESAFIPVDHIRKADLKEKFIKHGPRYREYKDLYYPTCKVIHVNPVDITNVFNGKIKI